MADFNQMPGLIMASGGVVSLDARAVRASVTVVSKAGPADMTRPTPCEDWTLGQLLAHMTVQHEGFAAAAEGNGADPSVWRARTSAADPVAEYVAAADLVLHAFAADGVVARDFVLPELDPAAPVPGGRALLAHFIDYVTHGWDVARSLGLEHELDREVLGVALPIAEAIPDDESRLRFFAPRVIPPEAAGPLDRIVALLGRHPGWRPPEPAAA